MWWKAQGGQIVKNPNLVLNLYDWEVLNLACLFFESNSKNTKY